MTEEVHKAAECIDSGGVILYPTDTIWGIGCDAKNSDAVEKIYRIKQRSDNKSMLVLMNGIPMLESYLEQVPEQTLEILNSARKPTTIIYPGARNLAKNLLAEDGSLGIRITSDPFCHQLIELTGLPIVSTSANISGLPSPSIFSEIESGIKGQVDYVVNWRQEEHEPATPSAIIKLGLQGDITILRP
ncbi:MAG: L-threonylcarbamoyladenylate synthase [Bacteroidota bacterium]